MTRNLAPPPPGPTKSESRRRVLPWLSEKPETRAVQIGVLGTILIHLILLLLAPHLFRPEPVHPMSRSHVARQFNIQLQPNLFKQNKPLQKQLPKFVETNPNAPENTPDRTNNVSDRNQQVAQEKPTPNGKSDHPALTGQTKIKTAQIVDGRLTKPQEPVPVAPPTPTKAAPPANQRQEQNPLPGFEKTRGSDVDGSASNVAKFADNAKPIPEKIDGAKEPSRSENAFSAMPQIDPKHPRPRLTLEQHVRPAIFTENQFGTSNVGPIAMDARWSNYGAYMKRLVEIVQIEFDQVADASQIAAVPGSYVTVKLKLNSRGRIEILDTTRSDGATDEQERAAVRAVTDRQPYEPWTDDMIATFGSEQELTWVFYFE